MTDPPPLGAPYCHKRTTRAIAGRSRSHAVRSRRISRMRCPACRTENRPGVRFCEECGATLDVVCPACGAGVPTGKKFCGACGAPLAMLQTPARYRDEPQATRAIDFRVRMGLNTGLVVVGAIGDNLRMDYTAVGDTTNTAARMQQLAEPGAIVVAEASQKLIAPYFATRALGAVPVKGKSQPVAAYELLKALEGVTRLDARAARGRSAFVGRDDALETLARAWAQVRGGRGQAVFVLGDAGIGKSRLLFEFRRRIGDTVTWIEGDCISFGQSIPFLPIVQMLKRNFGIEDHDSEERIVARVHHGVAFLGEEAASVEALLRYLLAVDPGDPAVAALDPVQRRARVVTAIHRLTATGSRRRPVVLVVEDAHWIDGASEDFL